jgi:hypothetical protein
MATINEVAAAADLAKSTADAAETARLGLVVARSLAADACSTEQAAIDAAQAAYDAAFQLAYAAQNGLALEAAFAPLASEAQARADELREVIQDYIDHPE